MDKLIESAIHKNFAELYKSGTREELKKYHSVSVEYNLKLHEEIQIIKQQLKEANSVMSELADLMEGIREGEYNPDSLTNQPYRQYLNKYKVKE